MGKDRDREGRAQGEGSEGGAVKEQGTEPKDTIADEGAVLTRERGEPKAPGPRILRLRGAARHNARVMAWPGQEVEAATVLNVEEAGGAEADLPTEAGEIQGLGGG